MAAILKILVFASFSPNITGILYIHVKQIVLYWKLWIDTHIQWWKGYRWATFFKLFEDLVKMQVQADRGGRRSSFYSRIWVHMTLGLVERCRRCPSTKKYWQLSWIVLYLAIPELQNFGKIIAMLAMLVLTWCRK